MTPNSAPMKSEQDMKAFWLPQLVIGRTTQNLLIKMNAEPAEQTEERCAVNTDHGDGTAWILWVCWCRWWWTVSPPNHQRRKEKWRNGERILNDSGPLSNRQVTHELCLERHQNLAANCNQPNWGPPEATKHSLFSDLWKQTQNSSTPPNPTQPPPPLTHTHTQIHQSEHVFFS